MIDFSVQFISSDSILNNQALQKQVEELQEGYVCICSRDVFAQLDLNLVNKLLQQADVLHSGLLYHEGRPFERIQLCAFNWHFLNPPSTHSSNSWKVSPDLVIFDKVLYNTMGGFDIEYEATDTMLMDFSYRVLVAGGVTLFNPCLANIASRKKKIFSSYADEARFILKHLNQRAFFFYRFCVLFLHFRWISKRKVISPMKISDFPFKLLNSQGERYGFLPYTAIIPTIDRYDYIKKSVDSLLKLNEPPSEIIVVDQTPIAFRNELIYKVYQDRGILKVIYLEEAGQSTARNIAIHAATHPWLLLFEDDAEAWPDMVKEHLRLLSRSNADVSSGVVVAPSKDESFILQQNRRFFISDIFTTGNAFVSKETLLSVKGFDPAFDRGSGADDDIGKRLYLAGKQIVYNYKSIETHHKAPSGGMRVHGAWWRNKSTLFGSFPPATQYYAIEKYYRKKFMPFLILLLVLKAKKKYSWPSYLLLLVLLPMKIFKAWRGVKLLRRRNP